MCVVEGVRVVSLILLQPFDQRKKWFYDNLYVLKEPENPLLGSQREEAITIERGEYTVHVCLLFVCVCVLV